MIKKALFLFAASLVIAGAASADTPLTFRASSIHSAEVFQFDAKELSEADLAGLSNGGKAESTKVKDRIVIRLGDAAVQVTKSRIADLTKHRAGIENHVRSMKRFDATNNADLLNHIKTIGPVVYGIQTLPNLGNKAVRDYIKALAKRTGGMIFSGQGSFYSSDGKGILIQADDPVDF